MRMPIRWTLVLVVAAAAALGANPVQAHVAVADAQAFIGDWDVSVESAGTTFRINITDSSGQVGVAVTGSQGGNFAGERVRKEGANLKFNYTTNLQGMDIPAEVTLTAAEGGTLSGTLDLAAGQFSSPIKATKRQ